MKVEVITPSEELFEKRDYRGYLEINIDGTRRFAVHEGETEDASLMRDFNDVYTIPDLMRLAYEAGKRGEEFEVSDVVEEV